jgi:hypothetical protein
VSANREPILDRRRWLRHKVHTPAFASFDGVTGGMILDLSEEGLSMQTAAPIEARRRIQLKLSLPQPATYLETTGYVAWADALGRAGVRLSELPADARERLKQWLTLNDAAPSHKAPKLNVGLTGSPAYSRNSPRESLAVTFEPAAGVFESGLSVPNSTTAQYEFKSLGTDLNAALRLVADRARSLTRGTGAAIALLSNGSLFCRASIGQNAPPLGARLDTSSGFSAECVRSGTALRCDSAEIDPRVNADTCRELSIASILAAPIQYERNTIGLLEVFSDHAFAFDEGDVAVVERLSQTVLLLLSDIAAMPRV